MFSKIIKVIIIAVLLILLVYAGTCAYANFFAKPDTGLPKLPEADEAKYSVHIKNSGNLIFTNEFEQFGEVVGERTFILHGYWEMVGQEFKYRKGDIILSEQVFGEITIRRRNE